MAKDPAFLFYPNDWLGGTLGMTFYEKGAYMELLMMQFNRGHMTDDMIGHVLGQERGRNVVELWLKLKDKFIQDENGLWYNERLEVEQIKRATYVKSRGNNKLGKNQYDKNEEKNRSYDQSYDTSYQNHKTNHVFGLMENENENKEEIGGVGGKEEPEKKNKFCTMPLPEHFNGLPENKIPAALESHSLAFGLGITESDVSRMWNVFKTESLTGKNHYDSEEKVYTHFLRWIRKQPLNKPKNEIRQQPKINL